jgi:mRNA-degrading endonuclease RelE of RelBE toxin-antitoxin system
MSTVRIPISDTASNNLKRLSRQKQSIIRSRISSILEEEIKNETLFDLNDYQDVMNMTDREMLLTFGEEYLKNKGWVASGK